MPLAANSGGIHSEADANQPLQYPPLTASSDLLILSFANCQSQAQDTSDLDVFPPPSDVSHSINSMPEFSYQVLNFDQGSNEISNFHGFSYRFLTPTMNLILIFPSTQAF
jgi:CRISPR-associated DxTHG motif protein